MYIFRVLLKIEMLHRILESKLTFNEYIEKAFGQVHRGIL